MKRTAIKHKPPDMQVISRQAWKLMSRYVRLSGDLNGEWRCVTCGKPYSDIRDISAGHFKHDGTKNKSNPVSYDGRNVWPQCTSCNTFGNGKLDIYAEKLVERYGPDILSELSRIKHSSLKGKDKREFFTNKIAELTEKLADMEE